MREIRAWNSHSRIMEYPEQYHPLFGISFITYMQSAGMRDKNEKKIYEGDIVKFNGQIGTIVFEAGAFGISIQEGVYYDAIEESMFESEDVGSNEFNGCYNDNFISLWEIYWNFNCMENYLYVLKVIGNIYENSELLEV